MKYSVKNVKSFQGMEGYGYNCSLYRDKHKVAFVIDEGNGGDILIRWLDVKVPKVEHEVEWGGKKHMLRMTPEEKTFRIHCDAQPVVVFHDTELTMNADILIGDLVAQYEEDKQLRRWCKKDILYRLKGDKPGAWRVKSMLYTQAAALPIRLIHDAELDEIANERFA